jgi:hypothetical protein
MSNFKIFRGGGQKKIRGGAPPCITPMPSKYHVIVALLSDLASFN